MDGGQAAVVLADRMYTKAPTGKFKEEFDALLFDRAARRNHTNPYEEKPHRGAAIKEEHFFCLMAAWLNEGRCPGGRPSVSTNYITIEASGFCIEMITVHAIYNHRIKLAVSQRVPFR